MIEVMLCLILLVLFRLVYLVSGVVRLYEHAAAQAHKAVEPG